MSASVFWHSYLFNVPLFIAILAILPWRIPWRAPHPWLWACYIAVVQSVKLYLQLDSVLHDTTASLIMWGLPQQIFNILMMSFCIGISLPEACLFFSLLFLFVDRASHFPFSLQNFEPQPAYSSCFRPPFWYGPPISFA